MTDTSIEKLKTIFRKNLKTQREQVSPQTAQEASENLWSLLKSNPRFQKTKRIAAFSSIGTEINTTPILEGILSLKKELYLPKTDMTQSLLHFHPVKDLKTLIPGPFNILEPSTGAAIPPGKIDLILVPGLAFDNYGHRLGYGQGYYDRYLKVLEPGCFIMGVAYSFQIIEKIPKAEHDVPVNAVLTEKCVLIPQ